MKTKEEMDELLKGAVVHCKTEEEANQVLALADELGYKWCDGDSFKDSNRYNIHRNKTYYNICEGYYGDLDDYSEEGYKIITAQEFINLVNEENKMETKEIKTEVNITSLIPEGYEIDEENSTFKCIKFKKKSLTYDDIAKELFYNKESYWLISGKSETSTCTISYKDTENCTSEKQVMKLAAINKLLNVAKYLNKDWKPNWDNCKEKKWNIHIIKRSGVYYSLTSTVQEALVNFRTKELAQQAVEILGEDTINIALSNDY